MKKFHFQTFCSSKYHHIFSWPQNDHLNEPTGLPTVGAPLGHQPSVTYTFRDSNCQDVSQLSLSPAKALLPLQS